MKLLMIAIAPHHRELYKMSEKDQRVELNFYEWILLYLHGYSGAQILAISGFYASPTDDTHLKRQIQAEKIQEVYEKRHSFTCSFYKGFFKVSPAAGR